MIALVIAVWMGLGGGICCADWIHNKFDLGICPVSSINTSESKINKQFRFVRLGFVLFIHIGYSGFQFAALLFNAFEITAKAGTSFHKSSDYMGIGHDKT